MEPEEFQARSDGRLLCSRKDGAGARLTNLLWTWRAARRAGLPTLCFWPPMDAYYGDSIGAADVLDTFTLATTSLREELQVLDGRPSDILRAEVVTPDPERPFDPASYVAKPGAGRTRSTAVQVIDSGMPLLAEGESEEAAAEEIKALFARLPLNRTIHTAVKDANREHHLHSMVAVHVRRGDIVKTLRAACRDYSEAERENGSLLDRYTAHFLRCCPPPDSYFRLIRDYRARRCKVLFFSDSPDAVEPFLRRFGEEITLARDLAPEGLNGVQQAFFEMLLMSRCRAIIGAKSLFSRTATLIGTPRFIDARRHSSPEEFLKTYKQAVRFDTQAAEVQEGLREVLLRRVAKSGFGEMWNTGEDDILRLLEAA